MYIFEVTTPGSWLDYPDPEWTFKIQNLLQNLQTQFYEANAALNLFEESEARQSTQFTPEQWQADADRCAQLQMEIEEKMGFDFSPDSRDRILTETKLRFKREKWKNGHVPPELERNMIFIFARAFVYALDGFDRSLGVLATEHGVPARLTDLSVSIESHFPDLRKVRNSTQHLEDRSREALI